MSRIRMEAEESLCLTYWNSSGNAASQSSRPSTRPCFRPHSLQSRFYSARQRSSAAARLDSTHTPQCAQVWALRKVTLCSYTKPHRLIARSSRPWSARPPESFARPLNHHSVNVHYASNCPGTCNRRSPPTPPRPIYIVRHHVDVLPKVIGGKRARVADFSQPVTVPCPETDRPCSFASTACGCDYNRNPNNRQRPFLRAQHSLFSFISDSAKSGCSGAAFADARHIHCRMILQRTCIFASAAAHAAAWITRGCFSVFVFPAESITCASST